MKKVFRVPLFLIIAIMVLALCGCAVYNAPTGAGGGIIVHDLGGTSSYSLYPQSMELIYNGAAYTYDISRNGDAITYTVYYPNGGSYYETRGNSVDNSGWNDSYRPDSYVRGEELVDILSSHYYTYKSAPNIVNVIGAVLCIGLGAFGAIYPETYWYLSHLFRSWQYESIEPSDAGITWTRVGGVVVMILGVVLFFSNWS